MTRFERPTIVGKTERTSQRLAHLHDDARSVTSEGVDDTSRTKPLAVAVKYTTEGDPPISVG